MPPGPEPQPGWHPPPHPRPVDLAVPLIRCAAVPVRVQVQQTRKACWAAVAVTVATHYGDMSWTQAKVADALAVGLDEVARVDHALAVVGCLRDVSRGSADLDAIATEIDAGRPLCAVLEWDDGGVHFVLIYGYEVREGRTLALLGDPRIGCTYHLLRDFPRNYGRGGRWTWTCWLP